MADKFSDYNVRELLRVDKDSKPLECSIRKPLKGNEEEAKSQLQLWINHLKTRPEVDHETLRQLNTLEEYLLNGNAKEKFNDLLNRNKKVNKRHCCVDADIYEVPDPDETGSQAVIAVAGSPQDSSQDSPQDSPQDPPQDSRSGPKKRPASAQKSLTRKRARKVTARDIIELFDYPMRLNPEVVQTTLKQLETEFAKNFNMMEPLLLDQTCRQTQVPAGVDDAKPALVPIRLDDDTWVLGHCKSRERGLTVYFTSTEKFMRAPRDKLEQDIGIRLGKQSFKIRFLVPIDSDCSSAITIIGIAYNILAGLDKGQVDELGWYLSIRAIHLKEPEAALLKAANNFLRTKHQRPMQEFDPVLITNCLGDYMAGTWTCAQSLPNFLSDKIWLSDKIPALKQILDNIAKELALTVSKWKESMLDTFKSIDA